MIDLIDDFETSLTLLGPAIAVDGAGERFVVLHDYCRVLGEILKANADQRVDQKVVAEINRLLYERFPLPGAWPPRGRQSRATSATTAPDEPSGLHLFVMAVSALTLDRLELKGADQVPYARDFTQWYHSGKAGQAPETRRRHGGSARVQTARRPSRNRVDTVTRLSAADFIFKLICPLVFPTGRSSRPVDTALQSQFLETLAQLLKFFGYTPMEAQRSLKPALHRLLDRTPERLRLDGKHLVQLRVLHDSCLSPSGADKEDTIGISGLDDLVYILAANDGLCRILFVAWGWVVALRDCELVTADELARLKAQASNHLFKEWDGGCMPTPLATVPASQSSDAASQSTNVSTPAETTDAIAPNAMGDQDDDVELIE